MKFIIDAQLPPILATFIQRRGHDAIHVAKIGLLKDEDFAIRRTLAVAGPQIVWLRIGNCSNNALLTWFGSIWLGVERQLIAGDSLIEVV